MVFADVCKQGVQFPLAGIASDLHSSGHLPGAKWRAVGATNTSPPPSLTLLFSRSVPPFPLPSPSHHSLPFGVSVWFSLFPFSHIYFLSRYNPLGNTSTFLNVSDVAKAVEAVLRL